MPKYKLSSRTRRETKLYKASVKKSELFEMRSSNGSDGGNELPIFGANTEIKSGNDSDEGNDLPIFGANIEIGNSKVSGEGIDLSIFTKEIERIESIAESNDSEYFDIKDLKPESEARDFESDDESIYESDDEEFIFSDDLGSGTFATGRLFMSHSGELRVILAPFKYPYCEEEVLAKFAFFKARYPNKKVHLIKIDDTYRLILPYIKGTPYGDIDKLSYRDFSSDEEQINLFFSAIEEVERCHQVGIVIVDLKEDNILLDDYNDSFLIDGGSSVKIGMPLLISFQESTIEKVIESRKRLPFNAPECFTVKPKQAIADVKMDVYSLGNMLQFIFTKPSPYIMPLLEACQREKPEERPTLATLKNDLLTARAELEVWRKKNAETEILATASAIDYMDVDFKGLTTLQQVNKRRKVLSESLKQIKRDLRLIDAYKILDLTTQHPAIHGAIKKKNMEIEQKSKQLECRIALLERLHFDDYCQGFAKMLQAKFKGNDAVNLCQNLENAKENFLQSNQPFAKGLQDFKKECVQIVQKLEPLLRGYCDTRDAMKKFVSSFSQKDLSRFSFYRIKSQNQNDFAVNADNFTL